MYKLSLCIATNGVVEWMTKVLDSIFLQGVEESLYQVVITNNGNNGEFDKFIEGYTNKHKNIVYKKTNSQGFLNIIDCFNYADGAFMKFINHRFEFLPGTIQYLLDFVDKNIEKKQYVYFTNGVLNLKNKNQIEDNFNSFVHDLKIYSQWSAGLAFWREDYVKIPKDLKYDDLFPNTSLLFYDLNKESYLINDEVLFRELPTTEEGKGEYDYFYAFAVRYIELLQQLYNDKRISLKTFNYVKNQNLSWLATSYYLYVMKKSPCSYRLDNYKDSINVYYSMPKLWLRLYKVYIDIVKDIYRKIKNK